MKEKSKSRVNAESFYYGNLTVKIKNSKYQVTVGRVDGKRVYFKEWVAAGQLKESTTYNNLKDLKAAL